MKQSFFKSLVVALFVVATLASTKNAKADIIGVGLGYQFEPSRIAIDFLIPLKHQGAKRPQGGVLNLGLNIRGGFRRRVEQGNNFDWLGFSLPVAYEHVFDNGISILGGAEFVYYSSNSDLFSNFGSSTSTSNTEEKEYGGGIVLGTHYFFKGGVFLGFRVSAGAIHQTYAYSSVYTYVSSTTTVGTTTTSTTTTTPDSNESSGIYGYAAPTLSVGYMF